MPSAGHGPAHRARQLLGVPLLPSAPPRQVLQQCLVHTAKLDAFHYVAAIILQRRGVAAVPALKAWQQLRRRASQAEHAQHPNGPVIVLVEERSSTASDARPVGGFCCQSPWHQPARPLSPRDWHWVWDTRHTAYSTDHVRHARCFSSITGGAAAHQRMQRGVPTLCATAPNGPMAAR